MLILPKYEFKKKKFKLWGRHPPPAPGKGVNSLNTNTKLAAEFNKSIRTALSSLILEIEPRKI